MRSRSSAYKMKHQPHQRGDQSAVKLLWFVASQVRQLTIAFPRIGGNEALHELVERGQNLLRQPGRNFCLGFPALPQQVGQALASDSIE